MENLDKHMQTVINEMSKSVQTIVETPEMTVGALIAEQQRYTQLQMTAEWLRQMKSALSGPSRIVPPSNGGGLSIIKN